MTYACTIDRPREGNQEVEASSFGGANTPNAQEMMKAPSKDPQTIEGLN